VLAGGAGTDVRRRRERRLLDPDLLRVRFIGARLSRRK
jgi:hypothetical protein